MAGLFSLRLLIGRPINSNPSCRSYWILFYRVYRVGESIENQHCVKATFHLRFFALFNRSIYIVELYFSTFVAMKWNFKDSLNISFVTISATLIKETNVFITIVVIIMLPGL